MMSQQKTEHTRTKRVSVLEQDSQAAWIDMLVRLILDYRHGRERGSYSEAHCFCGADRMGRIMPAWLIGIVMVVIGGIHYQDDRRAQLLQGDAQIGRCSLCSGRLVCQYMQADAGIPAVFISSAVIGGSVPEIVVRLSIQMSREETGVYCLCSVTLGH